LIEEIWINERLTRGPIALRMGAPLRGKIDTRGHPATTAGGS
jgi:hypothetical protein